MSVIVPLVLFALAIAIVVVFSKKEVEKQQSQTVAKSDPISQAKILIHSINDDRCTGCDACVAVCPTNVLDLVNNKSRVLRFEDCIQCEACEWACPTEALVMHLEGTEPPPVKVPDIDNTFQTRVSGQYLIGEVAGKPLVKNAANLGRGVVEHIVKKGLKASKKADLLDVIIVGSGPGGMSAALSCIQKGLSYLVIEKEGIISSTVSRYPKGKLVMAEPYDVPNLSLLPVFDSSKEEIVPLWKDIADKLEMKIAMHETVDSITKSSKGVFKVTTSKKSYHSQRVIISTGTRGKPRTLGTPGEELPKVASLLDDPDVFKGKHTIVVGGGDSALEAAIALADAGSMVTLSYRGKSFHRAAAKNKQNIDSYAKRRRLKIKFQTEVASFKNDSVTLRYSDGTKKRYPNHAAFVLIGSDPPVKWLGTLGIHYVEKPHMASTPSSHGFVQSFVPNASPCPQDAAAAVAQVLGKPFTAPKSEGKRSRSRQILRAASQLFRLDKAGGKIDSWDDDQHTQARSRPASHQIKNGRRDNLDAHERTRVLRMLRDEGGRRAYEESKLELLDVMDMPRPVLTPIDENADIRGLDHAQSLRRSSKENELFDDDSHTPFQELALSPKAQGKNAKEVDLSSLLETRTSDDSVDVIEEFEDQRTINMADHLHKRREELAKKPAKSPRSLSKVEFDFDSD